MLLRTARRVLRSLNVRLSLSQHTCCEISSEPPPIRSQLFEHLLFRAFFGVVHFHASHLALFFHSTFLLKRVEHLLDHGRWVAIDHRLCQRSLTNHLDLLVIHCHAIAHHVHAHVPMHPDWLLDCHLCFSDSVLGCQLYHLRSGLESHSELFFVLLAIGTAAISNFSTRWFTGT